MSTVLWANQLLDGQVKSDESDKWALQRHVEKLDKLAASANLGSFSSLLDFTDLNNSGSSRTTMTPSSPS